MAIPFFLVQHAILIEVHPEKPVEHFAIVDLCLGEFSVVVLVPFCQGGPPGIEHQPPSRVAARRPGSHVNDPLDRQRGGNDNAGKTVYPPEPFAAGGVVARQFQGAGDQQLFATVPHPNRGGGVTADSIGPRGFPDDLACIRIECDEAAA